VAEHLAQKKNNYFPSGSSPYPIPCCFPFFAFPISFYLSAFPICCLPKNIFGENSYYIQLCNFLRHYFFDSSSFYFKIRFINFSK